MSNLGHIVYTRGRPQFDLSGHTQNTEGYGIVRLSSNIPAIEKELDKNFVFKALQMVNSSEEPETSDETVIRKGRFINSFVYLKPAVGKPLLERIQYRSSDEAAKSTQHSRPVFLNEALVGNLDQYPCLYFDADCFSAGKQPIDTYYQEDVPTLEPPIDCQKICFDEELRSKAMSFASDGRDQAVRTAVHFLLKQLNLPENERKFLIIRDSEEHVRLWIAAITLSMPLYAAMEITFNSNARDFLKLQSEMIYCVQKTTQLFERNFNIQNPYLQQRFFSMIVGADPSHKGASATAAPKPPVPYMVLDVATGKIAGYETDGTIKSAYYQDIVAQDDKIEDFSKILAELQGLSVSIPTEKLYDACQILSSSGAYSYNSLCDSLEMLAPHFTKESCLLFYVINRLCGSAPELPSFLQEDEKNELRLTKLILRLTDQHMQSSTFPSSAAALLKKRFEQLLEFGIGISVYLQTLSSEAPSVLQRTLTEIIDGDHLSCVPPEAISAASDSFLVSLFDMFQSYTSMRSISWSNLMNGSAVSSHIGKMLEKSAESPRMVGRVITILQANKDALDKYIQFGLDQSQGDRQKNKAWIDCLLANHVQPALLCDILAQNHLSEEIESILCLLIAEKNDTETAKSIYQKYLKGVPGTGDKYYRELIKKSFGSADQAKQIGNLLEELSADGKRETVLRNVLQQMDQKITLEPSKANEEFVSLAEQYANPLGMRLSNAALWKYINAMISSGGGFFIRKEKDGIVGTFMKANSNCERYTTPNGFTASTLGEKYIAFVLDHADEAGAFIIGVLPFEFVTKTEEQKYLSALAEELTASYVKRKNDSLALMLYLKSCVEHQIALRGDPVEKIIPSFDQTAVVNGIQTLLDACREELAKVKLDGVMDKLISFCSKEYGQQTAHQLEDILKEAQTKYSQQHKGGFFKSLFKK